LCTVPKLIPFVTLQCVKRKRALDKQEESFPDVQRPVNVTGPLRTAGGVPGGGRAGHSKGPAISSLKEREQDLQFELFQARLSAEDLERLEQEARAQVKPHLGLSTEQQLEVHKDTILQQWFAQRGGAS